jgi:hypothetical protein
MIRDNQRYLSPDQRVTRAVVAVVAESAPGAVLDGNLHRTTSAGRLQSEAEPVDHPVMSYMLPGPGAKA